MQNLNYIIIILLFLLLLVVFAGIGAMLIYKGEIAEKNSNKLMFIRVVLQAIVILLVGVTVYIAKSPAS